MSPHSRRAGALGLALATLLACSQSILAQQLDSDRLPPPTPRTDPAPASPADTPPAGMEIQGRGPIHEAFAEPFGNAKPGPIIPKEPPAPVAEEPPSQRPDGDNVQWIPGYWAWDPSRNDYLWVSGVWRNEPPGRKWAPGHWTQADGGWRWISGLWADANLQNLQYMAEKPPETLDTGPTSPAPDDSSLWVPGQWRWRDGQFVWIAGYWANGQPGMVWTPPDYYYTPSGYIYNTGYWDYVPDNRGVLFAPVYFTQPLWLTPGWSYRPWFYLGWDGIYASLWWGRHSYWFGDWYGGYSRFGFRPWFSFGLGWHDPLFNFYRWHYGDRFGRWYGGLRDGFDGRLAGRFDRPARTFSGVNGRFASNQLVRPLSQFSGSRLSTLSASQLAAHQHAAQQFLSFSQQRNQFERSGFAASNHSGVSLSGLPGGHNFGLSSNVGVHANGFNGSHASGYTPRFESSGATHFSTPSSQFGHSTSSFRTESFHTPSNFGTTHFSTPSYHYSAPAYHSQSFNNFHSYSSGIHSSSFGNFDHYSGGMSHFSSGFSGSSHYSGGGSHYSGHSSGGHSSGGHGGHR